MVRLKRSNQTAHLDLDAEQKLQEEEARSISHLRRELHNLVYERSCIQEEIEGCQAHRAKHEDLDILPASAIAPALLEEAKGDEEKVLKLRLQAECAERQKMCERIKELRARKEQLLKSGKEKASFFDGIQSHVVQLRDIVEPIRKQLSAEQMELHENTELAQKLPSALYVIYYQAVVYAAAHPAQMRVEINGDREQADHYLQQQSRGGDEDGELVDTFDRHPLSVSCTVLPPQERLSPITAKFHYLTRLQVVTGKQRPWRLGDGFITVWNLVTEKDTEKSPFRPFLGSLYPNDSGNSSPNPATASLLPSGYISSLFDMRWTLKRWSDSPSARRGRKESLTSLLSNWQDCAFLRKSFPTQRFLLKYPVRAWGLPRLWSYSSLPFDSGRKRLRLCTNKSKPCEEAQFHKLAITRKHAGSHSNPAPKSPAETMWRRWSGCTRATFIWIPWHLKTKSIPVTFCLR